MRLGMSNQSEWLRPNSNEAEWKVQQFWVFGVGSLLFLGIICCLVHLIWIRPYTIDRFYDRFDFANDPQIDANPDGGFC